MRAASLRAASLAFLWLAACSGPGPQAGPASEPEPWRDTLAGVASVTCRDLPAAREGFGFGRDSVLLVASSGWRTLDAPLSDAQRQGCREFVAKGGRLLLFGHAARLAAELGIEPEMPESTVFRWGFDGRTARGRARLGLQVVTGRAPLLFEGLAAAVGQEHVHLLAGGEPCAEALCAWDVGEPKQGEVLGRLAVERDGVFAAAAAPVLVRWPLGAGEVLACGIEPALDSGDAELRANARAFVQQCVRWLQRDRRGAVVCVALPAAEVPRPVAVPEALARRDLPMAPLLAHWGWLAPVRLASDGGRARAPDELVAEVLLPSWLAGADLLDLDLGDPARGLPLPWSPRDPLKPPPGYRGGDFWPAWNAAAVAGLAGEAHARGMLLQAFVDPLPVGERTAERLVALRFLARELACVRRLGAGAVDGFGVRRWWADGQGYGAAMLQDFHPGARLHAAGEQVPALAGGLRALDADDGVPLGSSMAGLSDTWRAGFPADLFPLGVLDARARQQRPSDAPGSLGGGSHGDWIVTQANDFVRARRGLGGAMWWRAHDPGTLGAETVAYVHGVSQEPLRAAVAMPLSATGEGGRRAAAKALLGEVQAGFGAEVPVPASVHVLQNNWLRLCGSGGSLCYDPTGLARFRSGEALVLSPSFVRTRLFGGRPDGDALRSESVDLLAADQRPAGGHGRTCVVDASTGWRLPGVLAFDAAPQWPAAAAIELQPTPGYHELELLPRGVEGRGIVVASVDGVQVGCVPFRTGERAEPVVVPVHIAMPGPRTLQLEVMDGGSVAFDRLRLVRRGDVGAEARVGVPAGSHARLDERSASSYHAERVELATIADFQGFLLRLHCERAVRNLQVERTFHLPAYRRLVGLAGGEDATKLRSPFVLRADDAALPDLVVVPLRLARHESFRMLEGTLVLKSAPEPGIESRVGFLLSPRAESQLLRQHAAAIFASIDQPHEFDLGDGGEATLVGDLPVAWTRIVRLRQNARTPYLVQENGWWSWRSAQPASDGGDWLRVCHLPGDVVQVVGGPAVLARTRPGPGSLHIVALRDPLPGSTTVRVLQPSRLSAPCVIMGADFDEVFLDGEPWAWFDGRTVYLPDRAGTWRIETRRHGGGAAPHVLRTRAPLQRCAFDPRRAELVLQVAVDPLRPVDLPYTAVLSGPVPLRIENGEVVDEASLRHADAETAAAARAGGVLIRFHRGVTKVHYGE